MMLTTIWFDLVGLRSTCPRSKRNAGRRNRRCGCPDWALAKFRCLETRGERGSRRHRGQRTVPKGGRPYWRLTRLRLPISLRGSEISRSLLANGRAVIGNKTQPCDCRPDGGGRRPATGRPPETDRRAPGPAPAAGERSPGALRSAEAAVVPLARSRSCPESEEPGRSLDAPGLR